VISSFKFAKNELETARKIEDLTCRKWGNKRQDKKDSLS